ncbi:MAG: hypothetical protein HWE13_15135 [Gammaproteobacteria bacterium]|nr:hypothetical protein [Gammaproteobacteria bacterium]NVK89470.1 hypothetical protein [Gammaproteobacteria bacterium]
MADRRALGLRKVLLALALVIVTFEHPAMPNRHSAEGTLESQRGLGGRYDRS